MHFEFHNSYIIVIYLQSATSLIVHVCLLRKEIFKIDNGFLNFLINVFEGWYCPVFEEKLGLVIEDYSSHCLECPEVYDSYNSSKCKIIIYIYNFPRSSNAFQFINSITNVLLVTFHISYNLARLGVC